MKKFIHAAILLSSLIIVQASLASGEFLWKNPGADVFTGDPAKCIGKLGYPDVVAQDFLVQMRSSRGSITGIRSGDQFAGMLFGDCTHRVKVKAAFTGVYGASYYESTYNGATYTLYVPKKCGNLTRGKTIGTPTLSTNVQQYAVQDVREESVVQLQPTAPKVFTGGDDAVVDTSKRSYEGRAEVGDYSRSKNHGKRDNWDSRYVDAEYESYNEDGNGFGVRYRKEKGDNDVYKQSQTLAMIGPRKKIATDDGWTGDAGITAGYANIRGQVKNGTYKHKQSCVAFGVDGDLTKSHSDGQGESTISMGLIYGTACDVKSGERINPGSVYAWYELKRKFTKNGNFFYYAEGGLVYPFEEKEILPFIGAGVGYDFQNGVTAKCGVLLEVLTSGDAEILKCAVDFSHFANAVYEENFDNQITVIKEPS